jgi:hypothetical protein
LIKRLKEVLSARLTTVDWLLTTDYHPPLLNSEFGLGNDVNEISAS